MITTIELGKYLARCRQTREMSLRDVQSETGISASTLSRLENGIGEVDTRVISILARYLDVPLEREKGEKFVYHKGESLPQIVDALIRRDPELSSAARDSLSSIFSAVYQAVAKV